MRFNSIVVNFLWVCVAAVSLAATAAPAAEPVKVNLQAFKVVLSGVRNP